MSIPSRRQCVTMMQRARMPKHIQRHSMMVAEVSIFLGRLLSQNSIRLDLELLEAGALLHDIAKAQSLETGGRHDLMGARILEEWGYNLLVPIVKDHVCLDLKTVYGPVTESLIVNYADKRVKHESVVSLEERFDDLMVRYGKTAGHRIYFRERFELYSLLEKRLFDHLPIGPVDDALMGLSLNGHSLEGIENHDGQKTYGSFVGGREVR